MNKKTFMAKCEAIVSYLSYYKTLPEKESQIIGKQEKYWNKQTGQGCFRLFYNKYLQKFSDKDYYDLIKKYNPTIANNWNKIIKKRDEIYYTN